MRILIVEDEFISRELLRHTLEPYGECDCVENGADAISAFNAAWADRQPYQLICLDIMMPGIDGHGVLRHIRTLEREKGICDEEHAVRVIMTTCQGDPESFAKAFEQGLQWYVTKPINRAQLLEIVQELGFRQPSQQTLPED